VNFLFKLQIADENRLVFGNFCDAKQVVQLKILKSTVHFGQITDYGKAANRTKFGKMLFVSGGLKATDGESQVYLIASCVHLQIFGQAKTPNTK